MSLRVYGNRRLKTPTGQLTRPTLARVREALFNIWQTRLIESHWLDLCAGAGSIGAEALGRGASLVIGIEQSSQACQLIRQNWQQFQGDRQQIEVWQGDVMQRLPALAGQQFDCIYLDPPYASGLYEPVLTAIVHHHLLAATGEVAIEHSSQFTPPTIVDLEICRQKRYGNTALTFYRLVDECAK